MCGLLGAGTAAVPRALEVRGVHTPCSDPSNLPPPPKTGLSSEASDKLLPFSVRCAHYTRIRVSVPWDKGVEKRGALLANGSRCPACHHTTSATAGSTLTVSSSPHRSGT